MQIHELRHVIRELVRRMPETERETPEIKELAGYGCGTIMHIVELNAPRLDGEDHTRDIDFTAEGIHARWQAGFADARSALDRKPWENQGRSDGRRCHLRFSGLGRTHLGVEEINARTKEHTHQA
jgi:hypothetical protein